MTSSPPRLLILSASAGNGHVRAADALLQAARAHPQLTGATIEHWDILQYTTPLLRHLYAKTYLTLINHAPALFGLAYKLTDTPPRENHKTLTQKFEIASAAALLKKLIAFQPDILLCTHFTAPTLISHLNRTNPAWSGKPPGIGGVKPHIIVTDLDLHATWLTPDPAHYYVHLDHTKQALLQHHITAENIYVTGIPIAPAFATPMNKQTARTTLNLHPTLPTLLLAASGLPPAFIISLTKKILTLPTPLQLIVLTGKNETLKAHLDALAASLPSVPQCLSASVPFHSLVTVPFTTEMPTYLAAADLLLSKSGGLTVAESLARNLPLLILHPIPGQEERNADLLLSAGTAQKATSLPTLPHQIEQLLTHPALLQQMRQNTIPLAKPNAARTILDIILASTN